MLQGAPYYSSPVYGQSHFKKFWLKKVETEDDYRKKPSYVVNCSPAEDGKPKSWSRESPQSSELDYTSSFGAPAGGPSEYVCQKTEITSDGSSSAEDAVIRRSSLKLLQDEAPSSNQMRTCADCKTVKTPLWRNGPRGPKSLCNACGIRYKKLGKRPAMAMYESPSSPPTPPISPSAATNKRIAKRKKDEHHHSRRKIKASSGTDTRFRAIGPSYLQSDPEPPRVANNLDQEGRRRWRTGEDVVGFGNPRTMAKDEEEGAVLLMALKCGVVS